MKQRDLYKSRLYRSEQDLKSTGLSFGSVSDIQEYVDKILSSRWWIRRYPTATFVLVKEGRSSLYAYSDWKEVDRIVHPRCYWKEIYVVHELSHVASRHAEGLEGYDRGVWADHGPEFVRIYLELVTHKLGPAAGQQIKASFDLFGIPWRAKDLPLTRGR